MAAFAGLALLPRPAPERFAPPARALEYCDAPPVRRNCSALRSEGATCEAALGLKHEWAKVRVYMCDDGRNLERLAEHVCVALRRHNQHAQPEQRAAG